MSVFMQPIYTQTVGAGGTSSVTFNNIPQGFTDLKIVINARGTSAAITNEMYIVYNGDNASNYSQTAIFESGNSNSSFRTQNFGGYVLNYIPGATSYANTFSNHDLYIPNYTMGTFKSTSVEQVLENNTASTVNMYLYSYLYRSTAPITSITFAAGGGVFAQGSSFTIYGISNVYDTAAPIAPTIGTITDQSGFASVSFTANDSGMGQTAERYAVTTTPSSTTTFGRTSPIVTPAALNTSYTYQVAAVNSLGSSISTASNELTTSNSYSSIATYTGTSNYIFGNIPQGYKHLQLRFIIRSTASAGEQAYLRFNGDTTNTYSVHYISGNGGTASSASNAVSAGYAPFGLITKANQTANVFTVGVLDILDYSDTTKAKTVRLLMGHDLNGSGYGSLYSAMWTSTSPITAIEFGNATGSSVATGTQYALYGIA
jgi:hypothetical protein